MQRVYIKKLILIVLILFMTSVSHSMEYRSAVWKKNSSSAYNECNIILSFICTMTKDVTSDVNFAAINTYLTIYDKKNNIIKKIKVKKIEYNKNKGLCWLTPQPIRGYTTYFVTKECIAK